MTLSAIYVMFGIRYRSKVRVYQNSLLWSHLFKSDDIIKFWFHHAIFHIFTQFHIFLLTRGVARDMMKIGIFFI